MLRHTLISNPLLSRATTKHICFDFSVSKMVRPVHFQSYSLFECAGGAGVCGRRLVIIFRCLVETGRTTRSGCRGACRKKAVNEANQSQNLCIWLCSFFRGKSTGAGSFFYDFYATFRGSSDPAALWQTQVSTSARAKVII